MKTRLVFVRHAEAEGNLNRIFHGWTDSVITPKGHLQAERMASKLKQIPIDVIYSSTLTRTIQTAEYIAKIKNLPIIRTDKLKEINGGDWEGEMFCNLPLKWPKEYETWESNPYYHYMPNGENMVEFQKRLMDEVMYIIKSNIGKNICLVTHGTAIRVIVAYFKQYVPEDMVKVCWYDNTSITVVDYENKQFKMIIEGDNSHLEGNLSTLATQDWWKK